jgi:putative transposase
MPTIYSSVSILRRYHRSGNIYFITVVTYRRKPILIDHFDLLWRTILRVEASSPYRLMAWVVLPDHLHLVVDPLEANISALLQRIKMSFAASLRHRLEIDSGRTWQNRFWDHIIRNQDDFNRHVDYIHFNPVKHRMANSPLEWRYSSFGEYLREGLYQVDWGGKASLVFEGDYGE